VRVSDLGRTQSALFYLRRHMDSLEAARNQLATGKRITRPSDDVAGTSQALSLRSTMAAAGQARRNAEDGRMWVQLADTALQDVVARLHRAKELAVAGASSTSPTASAGLADEVAALRADLLELANTRHQGRGLFAGFSGGDAVAETPGGWAYQGDQGEIRRRIGEGTTVTVNVTADEVFGFTSGRDLFSALDDLEARLRAGDAVAVGSSIDDVDDSLNRVLAGLARIGGVGERLDAAIARIEGDSVTLRQNLSALEDADLAGSVVTLEMQQSAYQAALAALRSIDFASLAGFLG
jgi:flagellar hook-associated protein 3 FlgL